MTEKQRILDALGEHHLRVPALIGAALAANDRAKYYFSLLQFAVASAGKPAAGRPTLGNERLAAGERDEKLDSAVPEATRIDAIRVRMPYAGRVCRLIGEAIGEMLAPLEVTQSADSAGFRQRCTALLAESICSADDELLVERVNRETSGSREHGDSLHLLVMDLHRALNALQAAVATETIAGARAYAVADPDRRLISAFMRGVDRTGPLKFEHPGLSTTVTRTGDTLVLQNDIGTTDAHVLVVHVTPDEVRLTYTDVHLPRLLFFQNMLAGFKIEWSDTLSRTDASFEEGVYHLAIGRFRARDQDEREHYLEFLGSRLVFLIDWNRARKRLRLLVGKKDVLELLKWAATQNLGHMAFLRIGAEQLVFDALASIGKVPPAFGARLDDLLGRNAAVEFLRFVLRTASEALVSGRTESLVHDEIRAELMNHFLSARQAVLDYASEQISLAIEIAGALRDCLLGAGQTAAAARRAKQWERRADELVNLARQFAQRSGQAEALCRLVAESDDIPDELEEATFHLSLLSLEGLPAELLDELRVLAELAVEGAQEYLKAIETVRLLGRGAPRADMREFLESIHRVVGLEQRSDEAQRRSRAALMESSIEPRRLFALAEIARNLETASDALMHSALMLRDHVLAEVITA